MQLNKKNENIKRLLKFDYCFIVEKICAGGGLALLWRQEMDLQIQSFTKWRHINAVVNNLPFISECLITGFYGHSEASKKDSSWDLLRVLNSSNNLP